MHFSSPIWLVLLVPWTAAVIWLLRGKFPVQGVPFLELWKREAFHHERPVRAWIRPPIAVLATLAAMLLEIVAAAGPTIKSPAARSQLEEDVQLESLAVRDWPAAQAMVRVGSQSGLRKAQLTLSGASHLSAQSIDLPARGSEQNYFIDLPDASRAVTVELSAGSIEHDLEVQQASGWPILDARGTLPEPVSRMINVYSSDRNPDPASKHIAIVASLRDAETSEPTAIVAGFGKEAITAEEPLSIRDSPITREIDWQAATAGATVSQAPGPGWQPLVSVGDSVLIAAREQPVREVWVGFQSGDFPRHADFVVFWSNVFNSLGESDWGQQVTTAQVKISSPPSGPANQPASLAGQTMLAAVGMTVLAAFSWKSRPRSARQNGKS